MDFIWKQIKNIFSKSEESTRPSLDEAIQQISDKQDEPVIKKLKREVNNRKNIKAT